MTSDGQAGLKEKNRSKDNVRKVTRWEIIKMRDEECVRPMFVVDLEAAFVRVNQFFFRNYNRKINKKEIDSKSKILSHLYMLPHAALYQ